MTSQTAWHAAAKFWPRAETSRFVEVGDRVDPAEQCLEADLLDVLPHFLAGLVLWTLSILIDIMEN